MTNLRGMLRELLHTLRPLKKQNSDLRRRLAAAEMEIADSQGRWRTESEEIQKSLWVPIGHFYSPIPLAEEIEADQDNIFEVPPAIRGVNLNEKRQLELFDAFRKFYSEQPFPEKKEPNRRYFFQNPNYQHTDALVLYSMIRNLRPRRIIEVGSGYSSCVTLDVNELFFDNSIECTFIEPYPQLLRSLIRDSDNGRIRIFSQKVQDVDAAIFRELEPNDILFIDSSHISKTGSDVNYILFKILPLLNAGVTIHFHDIHFPFEYPRPWIDEGRSWNETYILRAFLQYNSAFEIEFFSTYLLRFHRDRFQLHMPLCLENPGGNLWIRKTKQDPVLDRIGASTVRKSRPVPTRINPARVSQRWLLTDGWHDGEKNHCWIAGRASFRIAAPESAHQRLRLRIDSPHANGVHIHAAVDDVQLRPVFVQVPGPSEVEFELPESTVGGAPLQVELRVDKTFAAPNDSRELGLSIIEIEVR